jgi:hypothetical protein
MLCFVVGVAGSGVWFVGGGLMMRQCLISHLASLFVPVQVCSGRAYLSLDSAAPSHHARKHGDFFGSGTLQKLALEFDYGMGFICGVINRLYFLSSRITGLGKGLNI